jgi:hypothetical protein
MEPAAMSMCIRYRCHRKARSGFAVCDTCLECVLYGGPATCTPPAPSARAAQALSERMAGWSELEKRWAWGDR